MLPPLNPKLEARLRRAVPPLEADPPFVHRLRRTLLNSRQYTELPITRLNRAIGRGLPLAAAALALGFFAALGLNAVTSNPVMLRDKPPTSVMVVNPTVLEQLSRQGQIQTVTVSPAGMKLHRIHLTSGETLELLETAAPVTAAVSSKE